MSKQRLAEHVAGVGLGVLLVTLATVLANAQTLTPVRREPAGTPGWVFTPSIGVGGAWDDNVLVVNEAQGPPDDYASPIMPSLSLDFTGKRTRFSTGYSGSITLYSTLDELTSFEQHFRAGTSYRPSERVTLFVDESFTMAPTTDAIPLNGGVPFYRVGTRTNSLGGGLQAALQRHLSLRGQYTLQLVDFDFDAIAGRQLRGGYSHEFDLSVNRTLSPRLAIGAEYGLDRVRVTQDDRLGTAPDDRFNIMNTGLTVNYLFSPAVTFAGGVGIAHLGAGLTHDSQTAPAWRAAITYRMEELLVSAGYSRSYVPSFGFGGTLQNEQWSASVTVPFARNRAYASGGISAFNNDALIENQPRLLSVWLSGRAGYRVTRWLRIEGFYNRTHQDTRLAGGQISRNQIGFQVVTAQPFKLH